MEVAANSEAQREGNRLQDDVTGRDSDGRNSDGRDSDGRDSDPLGVVVVYGELVQAGEPLTGADLKERTLLPERTVEAALAELGRTDAVRVLAPRVDSRPTQYFAE